MSYIAALRSRERRTRRLLGAAVAALCTATVLGAILLTYMDWTQPVVETPPAATVASGYGQQVADTPAVEGEMPGGVSALDDTYPSITNVDPLLLRALRQATIDAAATGVAVVITSGWRSPEYQDRLLHDAVIRYGSEREASRWVATAETSAHVHGDAVDVGPAAAIEWLSVNGAGYRLCQTYANEPWHFEYRPDAAASGCPAMYADPASDPRMHSAGS